MADATTSSSLTYWPILVFGAFAMLGIVGLQAYRMTKGGKFSANFVKAYGLILIATLGTVLIFADVTSEAKTGAYTLLGTIAGYIAGTGKQTVAPQGGAEEGVL